MDAHFHPPTAPVLAALSWVGRQAHRHRATLFSPACPPVPHTLLGLGRGTEGEGGSGPEHASPCGDSCDSKGCTCPFRYKLGMGRRSRSSLLSLSYSVIFHLVSAIPSILFPVLHVLLRNSSLPIGCPWGLIILVLGLKFRGDHSAKSKARNCPVSSWFPVVTWTLGVQSSTRNKQA